MRRLKVLFVDHESLLGGAELSMVNLIAALKHRNIDIAAAIADKGELADALKKAGVSEIYYMPMDGWRFWETGFIGRLKLLLSLPILLSNIVSWRKLFRKVKPDIVHFNLTRLVDPVIAARWAGEKSIMHFRELTVQNKNFVGGTYFFYKLMHMASFWIANSDATASDIRRYAESKKLYTVNNGIDVSKFSATDDGNKHTPLVVAKIAGLVEWKNHKAFLDVAAMICAQRDDVVFWLVGRGSADYIAELQKYAANLGILDKIVFKGFIEDIDVLLPQIDILAHTSIKESFGRIYVEAMAASRPLVALQGPTTADIIADGETGYVIPNHDLKQMSDKINLLLNDEGKRRHLGNNGKARALRLFSLSACADNMSDVYNEIVHSQR